MNGFDDIEALLREWIGLDAATVGQAAVERAVRGRMRAAGLDDPAAFARLLRADPAARDLLVEDVIVAESWFFRDRQVFEFVADFVGTLAAVPGRVPVRILCAPAAAGEEPYSLAMALFEAGLAAEQFTIDAIDVSRRALERAAGGRYSANAFRNADLAFRERWFRAEGAHAVLDDRIRRAARFEWANLLDPDFAAGRPPYDVVFCRNLLIYLTAEARRTVEARLDRLLSADGLLVLGAAEPPIMKGDWIPAGAASVFALRRGVHAGPAPGPRDARRSPPARPVRPARPPTDAGSPTAAVPDAADLEAVLAEAGRLANEGRFAEAIDHCERRRSALAPAPELFFLMGMIQQSAGDLDRAESCFHKTLYLDANHEEAHLALALLARRRGDETMAERYRQSAARAAARKELTP